MQARPLLRGGRDPARMEPAPFDEHDLGYFQFFFLNSAAVHTLAIVYLQTCEGLSVG